MRINGETRAATVLDPDTHSILLRRLHPRINCYNDVLTFCFQANNDVKFIGSGEAAKALTYYVTDYITKTPLPTHIGLSALRAAVQMNTKKFQYSIDTTPETVARSLFTKCANAIQSRQEISHPQVMSYLIGGGDHYTSHKFETLYWAAFFNMVSAFFSPPPLPSVVRDSAEPAGLSPTDQATPLIDPALHCDLDDEMPQNDPLITLRITQSGLAASKSSQYNDYIHRSDDPQFNFLSLYQFVQRSKKVALPKPSDAATTNDEADFVAQEPSAESAEIPATINDGPRRGRPRNARGRFLTSHPQSESHQLTKLSSPVVPVVLGPTIPHPSKGEEAKELWSKSMLILFKPWRQPLDLKSSVAVSQVFGRLEAAWATRQRRVSKY